MANEYKVTGGRESVSSGDQLVVRGPDGDRVVGQYRETPIHGPNGEIMSTTRTMDAIPTHGDVVDAHGRLISRGGQRVGTDASGAPTGTAPMMDHDYRSSDLVGHDGRRIRHDLPAPAAATPTVTSSPAKATPAATSSPASSSGPASRPRQEPAPTGATERALRSHADGRPRSRSDQARMSHATAALMQMRDPGPGDDRDRSAKQVDRALVRLGVAKEHPADRQRLIAELRRLPASEVARRLAVEVDLYRLVTSGRITTEDADGVRGGGASGRSDIIEMERRMAALQESTRSIAHADPLGP